MKYLTGVILAAALAASAPLHAKAFPTAATDGVQTPGTRMRTAGMNGGGMSGSSTGIGGSIAGGGSSTDSTAVTDQVKPKPQVKKAERPKKPKSTNANGALTFDGSASDHQPKPKKPASAPVRHSGSVPVTREGGKTCSGQDEYRVCW